MRTVGRLECWWSRGLGTSLGSHQVHQQDIPVAYIESVGDPKDASVFVVVRYASATTLGRLVACGHLIVVDHYYDHTYSDHT